MHTKTIKQLSDMLANKSISSVELTTLYLDRIAAHQATNTYITVTPEQALQAAKVADARIASGDATPLTGIPIAHKDLFCTKGVRTTASSRILDNFIPPYNATSVDNLANAGMPMLGKLNLDEFAMGSANENSVIGRVPNPWNKDTVPGGSSGASAAAIASMLAPAATGTDTGGSIRQPASFCGITGLKPTYGRVSRYGVIAFASSLDCPGPMAQTAEGCAMLLNHMAGHDPKDSTSHAGDVPDYTRTLNNSLEGLRVGLPKEYFETQCDPSVQAAIDTAISELKKQGVIFKEVSLPHTQYATSVYYVVAPAEASANLSRYDGVRYGHRVSDPQDLSDLYTRSRSEGFGPEVQRRILVGTFVLSSGYYDAYYLKGQQVRRLIRDDFINVFKEVDCLLTPATPTTAFKSQGLDKNLAAGYLSDIYAISANLAGLPALALPAGMSDGMPIGLQLIGQHFDEARLFNVAHRYQQATNWHTQHPPSFHGLAMGSTYKE